MRFMCSQIKIDPGISTGSLHDSAGEKWLDNQRHENQLGKTQTLKTTRTTIEEVRI